MKKLKVIGSIICFFFSTAVFLNAVDFKTQSDVDNAGNWAALNSGNPGIFYGDFFLSTPVTLQSGESLLTNDTDITRTLTANKDNSFFSFPENSLNTILTINGLVLKGGVYKESSLKGGAAICVPGMNFTLNGNVSFIQNSAKEGAGGAIFLSSGSLTFMGNVVFNGNSALSGAGGAVYCGSGSVNFNSYVVAESNESSFGGAVCSSSIVLNDGGYFVDNKAKFGGAIFLSGGISTITANTKDVLFSGNTMQNELNTAYRRNDIYMEGLNNLTFDAASSKTITLNGGIVCDNNNSVVNKIGQGTLVFNGDFYLKTFYVYNGVLHFGTGSTFYGENVYFSSGVFIDMRNKSSNELKFQNLTSSASLYYDIDLYNKFSDIIVVENRAQMDGSKIKVALSGVYDGRVAYNVILATTGGSGNIIFDNTNAEGSPMTRVHWDIDYGAGGSQASWHEVNLTLQVDQLSSIDGLPDNERTTAFALDSDYGTSTGDFFFIIDTIDKMGNIVIKKEALNDLSGYIYANAITVPTLNAVRNNILSRLERSYFSNDDALTKRNIWGHWYSANNLYEGDNNSMGDFKSSRNGFQAGFDTLKEDSHIFGITIGSIDSKSTQNDDKVDINGYNAGCYGSYFFDNNLETRVLLIGGREKYTSARNIKYLNRKTSADFTGYSVNASAELAYNYYYSDKLCLKPFIGFDYGYVHIDDFVEKGADAADLNVFSNSYNKAGTVLGFQVNNGIESKFKWYAEIKTDLLLYGRYGEIQQKMKKGIQSMSIKGIENDIFHAVFGLGIIYDVTKSLSVYSNINTVIPDTQRGFYCNVGANFKFNIVQKDFYEKTSPSLIK